MTAQQYLEQTERAAKQLFEVLQYYQQILKDAARGPRFISSTLDDDERGKEFQRWHKQNKSKIQAAFKKQRKYFGQTISEGAICGSIIQIAFMGIRLLSKQKVLPDICKNILLKSNDPRVAFCIGREIKGVPAGLIIYAARNQYNHMDEKNNDVTRAVFDKIATYGTGGEYKDPAFDLENVVLENYSSNIVSLLDWKNHNTYLEDMKTMIL